MPSSITCLSGVDKIKCLDAVGALPLATAARVVGPADVSHLYKTLLLARANKSSPKFSNTQYLPSIVVVEEAEAIFHPVKM